MSTDEVVLKTKSNYTVVFCRIKLKSMDSHWREQTENSSGESSFSSLELCFGCTDFNFMVLLLAEKWYSYGHYEVWSVRLSDWHRPPRRTKTLSPFG